MNKTQQAIATLTATTPPATLDTRAAAALAELIEAGELERRAAARRKAAREFLRHALGGAAWGRLPDGRRVGFRPQPIAGYVAPPKIQQVLFHD